MKKYFLIALMSISLAACGKKLSGTYEVVDPKSMTGMISIEFTSGSKAIMNSMGAKAEVDYSIDGKNLKIEAPGAGNQIMTIQGDGSIQYGVPFVGNVTLQKKN